MSQGMALEGMRLVKDYLPRAYADGTDYRSPRAYDVSRSYGRNGFQKGLGAIHALVTPDWRDLSHAPRHHERGLHARRTCNLIGPPLKVLSNKPPSTLDFWWV